MRWQPQALGHTRGTALAAVVCTGTHALRWGYEHTSERLHSAGNRQYICSCVRHTARVPRVCRAKWFAPPARCRHQGRAEAPTTGGRWGAPAAGRRAPQAMMLWQPWRDERCRQKRAGGGRAAGLVYIVHRRRSPRSLSPCWHGACVARGARRGAQVRSRSICSCVGRRTSHASPAASSSRMNA